MGFPPSFMGWLILMMVGAMFLPWLLGTVLPTIFDFIVNFVLWLVWVWKYRDKK